MDSKTLQDKLTAIKTTVHELLCSINADTHKSTLLTFAKHLSEMIDCNITSDAIYTDAVSECEPGEIPMSELKSMTSDKPAPVPHSQTTVDSVTPNAGVSSQHTDGVTISHITDVPSTQHTPSTSVDVINTRTSTNNHTTVNTINLLQMVRNKMRHSLQHCHASFVRDPRMSTQPKVDFRTISYSHSHRLCRFWTSLITHSNPIVSNYLMINIRLSRTNQIIYDIYQTVDGTDWRHHKTDDMFINIKRFKLLWTSSSQLTNSNQMQCADAIQLQNVSASYSTYNPNAPIMIDPAMANLSDIIWQFIMNVHYNDNRNASVMQIPSAISQSNTNNAMQHRNHVLSADRSVQSQSVTQTGYATSAHSSHHTHHASSCPSHHDRSSSRHDRSSSHHDRHASTCPSHHERDPSSLHHHREATYPYDDSYHRYKDNPPPSSHYGDDYNPPPYHHNDNVSYHKRHRSSSRHRDDDDDYQQHYYKKHRYQ